MAMDNNEPKIDVLLPPSSEPIESLGGLEDVCLAALTARVWETCCWPDAPGRWTIGDYRFAIIEFEPAPARALLSGESATVPEWTKNRM